MIDAEMKTTEIFLGLKMSARLLTGLRQRVREALSDVIKDTRREAFEELSKRPIERRRLPDTREAITRHFTLSKPARPMVCPHCRHKWEETNTIDVYATVGLDDSGQPKELFIRTDKVGSTAHGAFDAAAMFMSIGLQYGAPLVVFLDKVIATRYGACGFTGDSEYPSASSVFDIVARWMKDKWCTSKEE